MSPIQPQELPAAVEIFLDAFYDNVRVVFGDQPRAAGMLDVWSFARDLEPGGFLAARDPSGVLGYALFTSSLRRLRRAAITSGRPLLWAVRALSGRYGIRWRAIAGLLWNKVLFLGGSRRYRTRGDAQLLNIAVAPAARGKGVARMLVKAGLDYMHNRNVPEVRLEVRPDNAAALAVYRQLGFVEKGRTRDVHGEWLVMTAKP